MPVCEWAYYATPLWLALTATTGLTGLWRRISSARALVPSRLGTVAADTAVAAGTVGAEYGYGGRGGYAYGGRGAMRAAERTAGYRGGASGGMRPMAAAVPAAVADSAAECGGGPWVAAAGVTWVVVAAAVTWVVAAAMAAADTAKLERLLLKARLLRQAALFVGLRVQTGHRGISPEFRRRVWGSFSLSRGDIRLGQRSQPSAIRSAAPDAPGCGRRQPWPPTGPDGQEPVRVSEACRPHPSPTRAA